MKIKDQEKEKEKHNYPKDQEFDNFNSKNVGNKNNDLFKNKDVDFECPECGNTKLKFIALIPADTRHDYYIAKLKCNKCKKEFIATITETETDEKDEEMKK